MAELRLKRKAIAGFRHHSLWSCERARTWRHPNCRPASACPVAPAQIQPQGEWSAKVEALLRRLLHLQTTTPNEKSLVFSQVRRVCSMDGWAAALCSRSVSPACWAACPAQLSSVVPCSPPPPQFPDALKLVALALQTNGIKFVQLLGGRQAVSSSCDCLSLSA